jgi:hypothetical protein
VTVDEADQLLRAIGQQPSSDAKTHTSERQAALRSDCRTRAGDGRQQGQGCQHPGADCVVRSGMKLGAMIPELANERVAERLRERGLDIDFSRLDPAALEAVLQELGDTDIEVDAGKAQVRISCE